MGKPYSEDLRARVVVAEQDGATIPETAERFGMSISSVVRFRRLQRETGSVSPAKFGGYRGSGPAIGGGAARYHAGGDQGRSGERQSDSRPVLDLPISSSFELRF